MIGLFTQPIMHGYSLVVLVPLQDLEEVGEVDYIEVEEIDEQTLIELGLEDDEPEELEV